MKTFNDELLVFKNSVMIKNTVDRWMHKVIDQMRKSNRFIIKKAILDLGFVTCSSNRFDWINNFPLSVCLTADNVWWTVEVENVFNEIELVSYIYINLNNTQLINLKPTYYKIMQFRNIMLS